MSLLVQKAAGAAVAEMCQKMPFFEKKRPFFEKNGLKNGGF